MRFAVAIRTVPARGEMFSRLIKRVTAEVPAPDGFLRIAVSADDQIAPNENGCRALLSAALGAPEPDWVIFLEDDAGIVDDFFGSVERWLNDWAEPGVHIYPLGSPLGVSDVPAVRWPVERFYCSVALAIRASMAESLVAYLRANSHVRTGFDIMSGHWHRTVSPSPYLIAAQPCLADHLGDESTLIETRPERNVVGRFPRFLGPDYSYAGRT